MPIERRSEIAFSELIANRQSPIANGFTLIEVMVVVVLLSLIVLALMAVFDSTQKAFRASITQTDVLEGGRAAMDLMASDMREMAPSFGQSNALVFDPFNRTNNVNFSATVINFPSPPSPLVQSLIPSGARTNVLESFFILSRGNDNGTPTWYGVGYEVGTNADGSLYPLYRFSMKTNVAGAMPAALFNAFELQPYTNTTVWSHLADGVVDLTVRAFNSQGVWMTANIITNSDKSTMTNQNILFLAPGSGSGFGETGFAMFSSTLPASVEIEMGVLEDQTLRRAEALPDVPPLFVQSNYLSQQSGRVHIFRQRVRISNVDRTVYQ